MEDRSEYISLLPEGVAEQQQRAPFEPLVIINPSLTPLSSDGARYNEGCLSVPGYQALVERYASVQVQGMTPDGRPLRLQANGWKARILQHECDHLQVGALCCCCCYFWLAVEAAAVPAGCWFVGYCAAGWRAGRITILPPGTTCRSSACLPACRLTYLAACLAPSRSLLPLLGAAGHSVCRPHAEPQFCRPGARLAPAG